MSSYKDSDKKPWQEVKWIWRWIGSRIMSGIGEESEKVGYDPEKGTNWCHLPVEMRMKCISEMDFQEKFHLRNTCSLERSLVDSKEMHFESVRIEFGCEIMAKFWKNEAAGEDYCLPDYQFSGSPENRYHPFNKALRDIARLLKMSTVDTLFIEYGGGFKLMPEIFEMNAPFRIRKIVSDSIREPYCFQPHNFFIKNCKPDVEEIDFLREQCESFYDCNYFGPEFPKISKFRIDKPRRDKFCDFFNTWSCYFCPKIGTQMEILVYRENSRSDWLLNYARGRKISSSGSVHRFRTKDSKKELVVTIGEAFEKKNFFSMGMTPTITFQIVAAQPKIVKKKAKKRTHAQSSSVWN